MFDIFKIMHGEWRGRSFSPSCSTQEPESFSKTDWWEVSDGEKEVVLHTLYNVVNFILKRCCDGH